MTKEPKPSQETPAAGSELSDRLGGWKRELELALEMIRQAEYMILKTDLSLKEGHPIIDRLGSAKGCVSGICREMRGIA